MRISDWSSDVCSSDLVYPSGNPKNKKVGMPSMVVGPGDGATFDIVSPVAGANVIVDHRMSHAHSGAMAVLMYSDDADQHMGRGDMIILPLRQYTPNSIRHATWRTRRAST